MPRLYFKPPYWNIYIRIPVSRLGCQNIRFYSLWSILITMQNCEAVICCSLYRRKTWSCETSYVWCMLPGAGMLCCCNILNDVYWNCMIVHIFYKGTCEKVMALCPIRIIRTCISIYLKKSIKNITVEHEKFSFIINKK